MLGLLGLAFTDPARSLVSVVACSAFTAFAGATQDIVVDGWRIDAAPASVRASWRRPINSDTASPSSAPGRRFLHRAIRKLAGRLSLDGRVDVGRDCRRALFAASGREGQTNRRRKFDAHPVFIAPITDLIRRHGVWLVLILVLVALYRLPDFLTGVMANPLYITLGFQKSDIATISKLYGIWIGLGGAFLGGIAVARLGLMPSLLIGGIIASSSHLCLALLATSGARTDLLILSVSVESLAGSFAGTALIAYMSSLVSPSMAASQYALLSSLYALPGKIIGGLSGFIVKQIGFPAFSSHPRPSVSRSRCFVCSSGRTSVACAWPKTHDGQPAGALSNERPAGVFALIPVLYGKMGKDRGWCRSVAWDIRRSRRRISRRPSPITPRCSD